MATNEKWTICSIAAGMDERFSGPKHGSRSIGVLLTSQECRRRGSVGFPFSNISMELHCRHEEVLVDIAVDSFDRVELRIVVKNMRPCFCGSL